MPPCAASFWHRLTQSLSHQVAALAQPRKKRVRPIKFAGVTARMRSTSFLRPPSPGRRRAAFAPLRERRLVPVEGIEPPLLAEHDFESCASTSSATRACAAIYIRRPARSAKRKSAQGALRSGTRQKAQKAALIAWTAFLLLSTILSRVCDRRRARR